MLSLKTIVLSLVVIAGFFVVTTTTYAQQTGNTRPGWGFGDQNHIHTGPPGQTVNPSGQNNSSVSFTVNAAAVTGGNSASNHGEGEKLVSIITGAASTVVSFVNTINQHVFGP